MMAMRQVLRKQTACAIFIFVGGIGFTVGGVLQLQHTETYNNGICLVIFGALLMALGCLICLASVCIQEEFEMQALFAQQQPLVPLAAQEQEQEQDQNPGNAVPAV